MLDIALTPKGHLALVEAPELCHIPEPAEDLKQPVPLPAVPAVRRAAAPAAVLYGIGARLDEKPELLFVLRGVDHAELVGQDVA